MDNRKPRAVTTIGICSGKGGVGKTSIAVNLAAVLGARGKETLLLDADLGLSNVEILMGFQPKATIEQVIQGECELDDVMVEAAPGVRVIPSAAGVSAMADLSHQEQAGLINAFSGTRHQPEYLIVDMAAGINRSVLGFGAAVQHVVVVVNEDPASITDAYGLIKSLNKLGVNRFSVIANMVDSETRAREVYHRLLRATDRFLSVAVTYLGMVPRDQQVVTAIQSRQPVMQAYPGSPASKAFVRLASNLERAICPSLMSGRVEFFVESLVAMQRAAGAIPPASTLTPAATLQGGFA